MPMNAVLKVVMAVAVFATLGCYPESTMDPIEKKLAILQQVAISHLETNRPENWEVHAEELRRGAIMYLEGQYRIGRWIWAEESSTLLRDADVAPLTIRYGIRFERVGPMDFRVSGDFWEREEFSFDE